MNNKWEIAHGFSWMNVYRLLNLNHSVLPRLDLGLWAGVPSLTDLGQGKFQQLLNYKCFPNILQSFL